jgi:hypothetical protein
MDVDMASAYEALKSGLGLFKDAISIAKGAKDLLPSGKEKDTIAQSLEAAERATQLAEAQIAQALGYHLCQCTFPPQIMLSKGYQGYGERFECPKCRKGWPPPEEPIHYPDQGYV